jgi:replication fork protection complex subunit Csm3/Swi3
MASAGVSARPLPSGGPIAGGNDLDDDLFNYEVNGEDDPFGDNYKEPVLAKKDISKDTGSKGKSGSGLGIDEEVEVTTRVPRVKLDEHR